MDQLTPAYQYEGAIDRFSVERVVAEQDVIGADIVAVCASGQWSLAYYVSG